MLRSAIEANAVVYSMYNDQKSFFWTADEIVFSTDYDDYLKVEGKEQVEMLKDVMTFIMNGDADISEDIASRLGSFDNVIVKRFLAIQQTMEYIHDETYVFMAEHTLPNDVLQIIQTREYFENKFTNIAYCLRLLAKEENFKIKLWMSACIEGIWFPAIFDFFLQLGARGLFPGCQQANKLIARDEQLHVKFAVYMLHKEGFSELELVSMKAVAQKFVDCFNMDINYKQFHTSIANYHKELIGSILLTPRQEYFSIAKYLTMTPAKINFFERNSATYTRKGLVRTKKFTINDL